MKVSSAGGNHDHVAEEALAGLLRAGNAGSNTTADHITGMPIAYGRALLIRLQEWAAQPDYTYRHHWQQGDFVIWDNTGAMHRVIPYDADSGRMMHRTSIAGFEPVV